METSYAASKLSEMILILDGVEERYLQSNIYGYAKIAQMLTLIINSAITVVKFMWIVKLQVH